MREHDAQNSSQIEPPIVALVDHRNSLSHSRERDWGEVVDLRLGERLRLKGSLGMTGAGVNDYVYEREAGVISPLDAR